MTAVVNELHDAARQVMEGLGRAAAEQGTWSQIAELGWLMIATPEEQGGLGLGLAGACALHMELGAGLARVPYLPAMLAIDAVAQGTLADQEGWLSRLTTGEDYVAAPLAHSALAIERDATGELRLSGTAVAVQSADRASHVLVCTTTNDCVALVPLAQSGVAGISRPTWDETRRLYDVRFDAVPLDPALILADAGAARALAARLATLRDFALAADAIGGATALLALTVEYLLTRQQFGRPLALFQSLKHRCADLKALTEGAAALLQDKLGRVGEQLHDSAAQTAGKAVKQLACSAFATVAEEALQLHGGIGMTAEHDCHLFLKRAMLNEHLGRAADSYELDLAARLLSNENAREI